MTIRVVSTVPPGYRELGEAVIATDLAVQFQYRAWVLWVPKSAMVYCRRKFYAAQWAVDTSREHRSAIRFHRDDDAYDHAVRNRGDLSRLYGTGYAVDSN